MFARFLSLALFVATLFHSKFYPQREAVLSVMAKAPTLAQLRTSEMRLSLSVQQKQVLFDQRKARLFAEKAALEELKEEIVELKHQHKQVRNEMKELEGY